jgi:hypothetical protein
MFSLLQIGYCNPNYTFADAIFLSLHVLIVFLFYYGWGGTKSLGTAATSGLLYNPRWQTRMIVEQLVEWRLVGETEVLGENLPQRHFVQHKIPHDQTRARNPGRRGGMPATNGLSYGAALILGFTHSLLLNRWGKGKGKGTETWKWSSTSIRCRC